MDTSRNKSECLYCNLELKGRSDKKYCDDLCRNSYHNRKNSYDSQYMRKINRILKKNRTILVELQEKETVSEAFLLQEGFVFSFFTQVEVKNNGKKYFFCYEYGYVPLETGQYQIITLES